ncbi:MAG TPA: FadR family transcriptional regulator [Anaerolineae bacterium]|nr:FadR family transcriptional regulator [Anaerolineae bacterium]
MNQTIMILNKLDSDFLRYLIEKQVAPGERLPSLNEISVEMGVSVGKLREQLEVARTLGFVSVRPRLGTHRESYSFTPAVLSTVLFGLGTGEADFDQFSQLRCAIETSFWREAVTQLTTEDKVYLQEIVNTAWEKLRGQPIHIPNGEHRLLHLTIFSRLNNPFVTGILEAYWDAYDASELTRYMGYQYWLDVWAYHERIVTALIDNEFEEGRQLLIEHFSLLPTHPA